MEGSQNKTVIQNPVDKQGKDVAINNDDIPAGSTEPTPRQIILLGIYHILWVVICIYLIISRWPELTGKDSIAARDMIYLVLLAGAVGSFIHSANSFIGFVGNKKLTITWFWWYIFRPFVGMTVALVFFLIFNSDRLTGTGFLTTGKTAGPSIEATAPDSTVTTDKQPVTGENDNPSATGKEGETGTGGNPYGFLVMCTLAGMFSDMATHKLKEIAKSLFNYQDDRKDKMKDGENSSNDFENPASQG